jgi:hypothetical protein
MKKLIVEIDKYSWQQNGGAFNYGPFVSQMYSIVLTLECFPN